MSIAQQLRLRTDFLKTKDVMLLLHLRRNTVCHSVRVDGLPAVRVGNSYRFDPRLLADWLEARSTGTAGRAA